jgi:16S rRNA (cytidine1402-2'-O)-methyltransferase
MSGTLYIVATPIGNLQDFSPRAQTILNQVNLIAAEDTRHSRHLLNYFGITTPLQALHQHNEHQKTSSLLERLKNGDNIALISDAGTPLISDPGHYLIESAHAAQITIVPIPGASALISALSVAGFSADSFIFEGFLPAKKLARQQRLEFLQTESRTLVFYEAPHRLINSLSDMTEIFGEQRQAVLVKELTKIFETIYRDKLSGILEWLKAKAERQKGEFVLIIQGATAAEKNQKLSTEAKRIFQLLRQELPIKTAAKLTSEITGESKNSLYAFGLIN